MSAERILAFLTGSYWAMQAHKLEQALAFLEVYAGGDRLAAADVEARFSRGRAEAPAVPAGAGVGVLPVYGVLSHRAHLVQSMSGPGGTSTEQLAADFDAMMANPDVGTIVLDVDSPGGNVAGVEELAAKIFAARGQKRVIAVANAHAHSAAYWIAAQAEQLVVTPSGEVGSVGVYAVHTDTTRRDQNAGVTRTVVRAGEHKAEGLAEPLGRDARAYLEQQLAEYHDAFVGALARGRGVTTDAVRDRFGKGRSVTARQAVALGMADRVATLEDVLGELGVQPATSSRPMREKRRAAAAAGEAPLDVAAGEDSRSEGGAVGAAVEGGARVEGSGEEGTRVPATVDAQASDKRSEGSGAAPGAPLLLHPAANGGASGVSTLPLAAVQSQELRIVTDEEKAAAALAAENARRERILELGALAGVNASVVSDLVKSGVSVEDARAKIAAAMREPVAVHGMVDREAERPFASLGEQLQCVANAGIPGRGVDKRLLALNEKHAGPTGGGTGSGSDGGFLVQPTYSAELYKRGFDTGVLASRCSRTPIGPGSDGLEVPYVDEDARTDGNRWGGVRVYRRAEAATVADSKPGTGKWEVRLEDMMGIAYMTQRLLDDAPAMASVYEEAFAEEFGFKTDSEIFAGTGVGQMLGFMNSEALVTVAAEGGQGADTIVQKNVSKMYSRMPIRSRASAVWLINADAEPELHGMTVGNQPVYMPPGGLADRPHGTLYGRPVLAIEQAAALGDVGDISFVDLSAFKIIEKDAVRAERSMHVRFVYDEMCFKWVSRINGAPKYKKPITPYKGNPRSEFVTLAAR